MTSLILEGLMIGSLDHLREIWLNRMIDLSMEKGVSDLIIEEEI